MLNWLLIFSATAVIDAFAALYWQASNDLSYKAGLWSMFLVFFGAATMWLFLHDPILVIPEAVGAWVGTNAIIWKRKHGLQRSLGI